MNKYKTWEDSDDYKDAKSRVSLIVYIMISVLAMLILTAFIIGLSVGNAHADLVESEDEIVRCVIGESASEGVVGMTAVSEAIRNRGKLKGVYGCKAKFVDNEPDWVWVKARECWRASAKSDLVDGADHWENTEDFGTPYWAESMRVTAVIGKHTFYTSK